MVVKCALQGVHVSGRCGDWQTIKYCWLRCRACIFGVRNGRLPDQGKEKGARLPVNSRTSLTSRREKNGEALGKTLGSLRMRGADVCNIFLFFSPPPLLLTYIVYRLHLRMDEISISLALCLSSSTRYAQERGN